VSVSRALLIALLGTIAVAAALDCNEDAPDEPAGDDCSCAPSEKCVNNVCEPLAPEAPECAERVVLASLGVEVPAPIPSPRTALGASGRRLATIPSRKARPVLPSAAAARAKGSPQGAGRTRERDVVEGRTTVSRT